MSPARRLPKIASTQGATLRNGHTRYGLVYTPTIIVLQHGHELGRIIERPQQSLAEDLAEIASKAANKI